MDRLEVLRRLSSLDPENKSWASDLEAMEQVRLNEMHSECLEAYESGDYEALSRIKVELDSESWHVPISQELRESVQGAHQKVGAEYAKARLQGISHDLNSAHASLDADAGRQARQQWNQFLLLARLSDDDELVDRAGPALDWLQEEDDKAEQRRAFAKAARSLESALEMSAPRETLERLYASVCQFDETLA